MIKVITVKEAILAAASNLGLHEGVEAYLNGTSTDCEKEVKALLRCFNFVEGELAYDYLPLCAEETVETSVGVVYYEQLTKPLVRVLGVTDEWGNKVPFKLFPQCLKAQPERLKIRYTYTPDEKGLEDSCSHQSLVSARLFGYGMAAEYSLALGLFEDAAVWDKKYKDAIAAIYHTNPCRVIRSRRWV